MMRHRTLLVVVAALLIAFAGCSSIGPQTSPSETSPEGTPTVTTPDPDQMREGAVEAMDGVQQYQARVNQSLTIVANLEQELLIEQNVAIDRAAGNLRIETTQSSAGREITLKNYIVNDTFYQRNPAFVQQFSTEWAVIDTVENLSRIRRASDPLRRQQRLLEISEVAYNGTGTVNGMKVYRIETTSAPDRLEDLFAQQLTDLGLQVNESTFSISNASFTFLVSSETNRPMKVTGRIDSSVSLQGQMISIEQAFAIKYDYDASVTVELPEEADSAVRLSEALNESTG